MGGSPGRGGRRSPSLSFRARASLPAPAMVRGGWMVGVEGYVEGAYVEWGYVEGGKGVMLLPVVGVGRRWRERIKSLQQAQDDVVQGVEGGPSYMAAWLICQTHIHGRNLRPLWPCLSLKKQSCSSSSLIIHHQLTAKVSYLAGNPNASRIGMLATCICMRGCWRVHGAHLLGGASGAGAFCRHWRCLMRATSTPRPQPHETVHAPSRLQGCW